ncbi:putative peptidase, partial [Candidatus Gastranaerophilus sp. (ex Termes propinquus)]
MDELREFLKQLDAEFLLLIHSQLERYTGFSGSASEAVLTSSGQVFLFVDSRYHLQADA